jgi:hypothetical protein
MGLEELPYSDACEISSFSFERRWVEQEARTVTDADGEVIVYYIDKVMFEDVPNIALSIAETQVDVVVPAATDLSNIVGLATISVGATIIPLEGSPKLGVRADFTQPRKYRIIASDGMTARDYTIIARKE